MAAEGSACRAISGLQWLNFKECSPAMLSAVGGLLRLLLRQGDTQGEQLRAQFSHIYDTIVARFRSATDDHEAEQWLRALYHIVPYEDYQFINAIEDEEYELIDQKRSRITARWDAEVATITESNGESLWETIPLQARLHRLWWLYAHTNIPALTKGNDDEARRLFRLSKTCFDHCGKELFALAPDNSSVAPRPAKDFSRFSLHASLYYETLCAVYLGKRNLAHLLYYKQFIEQLHLSSAITAESHWQRLEIETHYAQAPMHRADRYVLPELAILDPQACRHHLMKCYQCWADLDPDDDCTIDDTDAQRQTLALAQQYLYNWLAAKRDNHIPIPMEQEAKALTLILASSLLTMANENVINRASELLPILPASRNKTILAALLGFITDDHALLEELKADVSRSPETTDHIDPYELFVRAILNEVYVHYGH